MSTIFLTLLSTLACVRAMVSQARTHVPQEKAEVPRHLLSDRADEERPHRLLAAAYVINRKGAIDRWKDIKATPWFSEFGQGALPKLERYDARTPENDNCVIVPKTTKDCCSTSHKNVLKNFANNASFQADQWVLVLEDDADLHPSVPTNALNDLISESLAEALRVESELVYYGLCMPRCHGDRILLNSTVKSTGHTSICHKCKGFCTHAYAVRKPAAARLPDAIDATGTATVDRALAAIAKWDWVNMSFVGKEFPSPDERAWGGHYGIFYQHGYGDSLDHKSRHE